MPRTELFVGAIVRRGDEVLLVRQSPGHPLERLWTVPWGRVEPGESPLAAVLREVREEGGVDAIVRGFLGIQELPAPQQGGVALVYLCEHDGGDLQPQDAETDAAAYFSLGALDSLDAIEPWSAWIVRKLFAGRMSMVRAAADSPLLAKGTFL